jgi:hypothetical protein
MEGQEGSRSLMSMDWRWVFVTYCFFVLFVLFPTYLADDLAGWFRLHGRGWSLFEQGVGVAIVSGYVGFRSKRITIFEPGIASVLCLLTCLAPTTSSWDLVRSEVRITLLFYLLLILLLAFLIGVGGAAVGEWLQMRKEKSTQP